MVRAVADKKIAFFDSISIPLPQEDIFRRLGFRPGVTSFGEVGKKKVLEYILEALSLIELKAAVRRIPCEPEEDSVRSGNKTLFKSKDISRFLKGSRELLLMGATAGVRIYAAIGRYAKNDALSKAVVFDAVASEMVDAALDWLMKLESRQLLRENRSLSKMRFSCGFGDFGLENQKKIYRLLELRKIGVKISGDFILMPEKSVTAVAGIRLIERR